ncbi:MAG: metallophosphoesterase, partial [Clostridiaceae bacterium]|nr:metallophosphoesterase [Clostridiaceae bacterium]
LSLSESPYNIVYFHHSPYSTGPYGTNEKMQWDYYSHNVDIVLTGHDHIYSRIEKKGVEGMYYIVNGLGGKSIYDCNPTQLSEELFDVYCFNDDYGAIKATSTKNKLLLEFYSISHPANPIDLIIIE